MTPFVGVPQEVTPYLTPIFDRKARSVTALDVRELTSYTDILIIVEAGSGRQVTTMAEHIIKKLKEKKIQALGTEGIKEGEWALLDFGHIIIHVFETSARDFYDLEGLWSDASRLDLSEFAPLEGQEKN
ncbi:ribosome silencing factor [Desulfospira joergensenii]|uniref:ribosome silencing factor n=1 Tax=Desulfospira joergensenii TaxID=53329 RepID=UPI0003B3895C|nr:ribosome silencing factor [Desulfospira joergensenii]